MRLKEVLNWKRLNQSTAQKACNPEPTAAPNANVNEGFKPRISKKKAPKDTPGQYSGPNNSKKPWAIPAGGHTDEPNSLTPGMETAIFPLKKYPIAISATLLKY